MKLPMKKIRIMNIVDSQFWQTSDIWQWPLCEMCEWVFTFAKHRGCQHLLNASSALKKFYICWTSWVSSKNFGVLKNLNVTNRKKVFGLRKMCKSIVAPQGGSMHKLEVCKSWSLVSPMQVQVTSGHHLDTRVWTQPVVSIGKKASIALCGWMDGNH